jgi:plasmid stability protein
MGQVIVRNLDDGVIAGLKARAKRRGHSLEQELRDILTGAAIAPRAERLALSDRIRAKTKPVAHPLAEELIREDRDRR